MIVFFSVYKVVLDVVFEVGVEVKTNETTNDISVHDRLEALE